MSKKPSTVSDAILHFILAFIFFIVIPFLKEIAPDTFGEVMKTFARVFGQNSEQLGMINLFVTIVSISLIIYYRDRYNPRCFLRYLFLSWAFIIPNQLTGHGIENLLESMADYLLVNLTIIPFISILIGNIIFCVNIIRDIITKYFEISKEERDAIANIRKDMRIRKINELKEQMTEKLNSLIQKINDKSWIREFIGRIYIVLVIVTICTFAYAIWTKNTLAIIILASFLSLAVLSILTYGIFVLVGKIKGSFPLKGIELKGSNATNFFMGILHIMFLCGIILFLFLISSKTFDLSSLIKTAINNSQGSEKNLWELMTSFDFIASFIIVAFVFIVIIFTGLLMYFMLISVFAWAFKFEIKSLENAPEFYKTTEKIANILMEYVADSVLWFIKFAKFIPNFFENLFPVIFDENADDEYEFFGTVIDYKTKIAISGVKVFEGISTHKLQSITDLNGNYHIAGLHQNVKTLEFRKEGYQSSVLTLIEGASSDIELKPMSTG